MKSEIHLCEACARNVGLNSKLSNFSLTVPEMLSFLDVSEVEDLKDSTKCHMCGQTFMDYNREGKLGCPECYADMKDSLNNVIISYHGDNKHVGKSPCNFSNTQIEMIEKIEVENECSLDELQMELEKAVFDERYEDAAFLRDKIRNFDTR
jgi:protein arginine kinase activator